MRLTMEINVGENPDPGLLTTLLSTAAALDVPFFKGTASEIGDESRVAYEREGSVINSEQINLPQETATGDQQPALRAGRGGRKSNEQKRLEREEAERKASAQATDPQPEPAPPQIPAPPPPGASNTAPPPGIAAPPGVSLPSSATSVPPSAPATAMPNPPPASAGAPMSFDEFREAYRIENTRLVGRCFTMFKADKWPDGTPKKPSFTIESIPPADFERYLAEWSML